MENNRLAGTLSLCRRAGKLSMGFDQVKESVQKGNAQLILLARDLSPKTAQEIRFLAQPKGIHCQEIAYTMDELWYLIGKRIGVAAVTDRGFAAKLTGEMN